MTDKPKWVNYAGEICTGKDGKSKYIRIKKDFKALKGNFIQLKTFDEYLSGLVSIGKLSEEQKAERLEKIHWVGHVLTLPPQEFKEEDTSVAKNGWINNALELRKGKDGGIYFKVLKDFEVVEGHTVPLKKFKDHIDGLKERGIIDDEEYEKRSQASEWLFYVASIPPAPDKE